MLWCYVIGITVIPISGLALFKDWAYIQSETCLLFNFSYGHYKGWIYVFVFFVLFSAIAFLIMAITYVAIILFVNKVQVELENVGHKGNKNKMKTTAMKLMLVLVGSNLFLWFPILLISFLTISSVEVSHHIAR